MSVVVSTTMHAPALDLARPREGHVDLWVRIVVGLAVAATFAVLISAPRIIWVRDGSTLAVSRFWFHNALALGVAFVLAFACLVRGRGSPYVRLAVLLPIVQVLAMLAALIAWTLLAHRMPSARDATPLLADLPVRIVLPWTAALVAGGGYVVARPRRREARHATVMLALVYLLLLGLWLPLASNVWNGRGWHAWEQIERALDHPHGMIAFVVAPPFVAALACTATLLRWPATWRRHGGLVVSLLLLGLAIGTALRCDVTEIGAFVYLNFTHVLAAAGLVAVAAIATLGIPAVA